MGWLEGIGLVVLLIIVFGVFSAIKARTDNERYTIGSGLFRNSEHDLDDQKDRDLSDYSIYDKNGKYR